MGISENRRDEETYVEKTRHTKLFFVKKEEEFVEGLFGNSLLNKRRENSEESIHKRIGSRLDNDVLPDASAIIGRGGRE